MAEPIYRFTRAIVRAPAPSVVDGLRAEDRGAPSYGALAAEHAAYVAALEEAGVEVTVLPQLDAFPDSIFVEDPALVFSDGAILLRPGAESRAGEAAELAPALNDFFETVLALPPPGHVEGGDVLATPTAVLIGLSSRTDRAGAEALCDLLKELGRTGRIVETPQGVLHFKSDCALLDEETVFATRRLAASGVFADMKVILAPDGEEAAANALRVNDAVFIGREHGQSIKALERAGYNVVPLPTAEITKVDAGLSCMSLRWRA